MALCSGSGSATVGKFVMRRRDLPMLSDEEYGRLRSKSVTFVRHAESVYQADKRPFQAKCADKALMDAELTGLGRMQAAALGGALAQHAGDDDGVADDGRDGVNAYDLLVSSPLSRCMQTAALAFGGRSDRDITLLHVLTEKVDSYGDVGRPLAQRLASHKELEGWSWHADTSELDCADVQLWSTTHTAMSPYGPVAGRPYEDIHVSATPPRLSRVWSWLSSRSERRIVVVSHSKLLGFPDRDYGLLLARAKQVGRKFENAEAVRVTFAADDAAAAVMRTVSPAATLPRPSASPLDGAAGQPPAAKRSRTGGTEPLLAPQFTVDNLREGDQAQWERLYRGYIAFYERHEEQAFYDRHFQSFLEAQKHVRDGFLFNALVARDATDSSSLLGLVHFVKHRSMKGEVCYMQDLFTEPAARGQGVATQLIHAVVGWSRAQDISKVYWNTHSSNPAREKLYDVVGQHKGYVKYQIDV